MVRKSIEYHDKTDTYDDKQYTLYVNAEVRDTTEHEISTLMDYFKTCNPDDNSQGSLSEYVRYLKSDEKGNDVMFEEFEKEFEENVEKRTKAEDIVNVMNSFKVSFDVALKSLKIPEDDYQDYAELIEYFYPDAMHQ